MHHQYICERPISADDIDTPIYSSGRTLPQNTPAALTDAKYAGNAMSFEKEDICAYCAVDNIVYLMAEILL